MTMTLGLPSEVYAIFLTIVFVAFLALIQRVDEPLFNELYPWVFYGMGWICCVYNLYGTTISFDFLHLAIMSFTMGLSLQLYQLRKSSRSET